MTKKARETPEPFTALSEREKGDIKLWFGWGAILRYPTGPREYLREALRPHRRAEFLAMPRHFRKSILRFVIDETNLRLSQHTGESNAIS